MSQSANPNPAVVTTVGSFVDSFVAVAAAFVRIDHRSEEDDFYFPILEEIHPCRNESTNRVQHLPTEKCQFLETVAWIDTNKHLQRREERKGLERSFCVDVNLVQDETMEC